MVAGGLLLSPWVDLTSSQPSILTKNNDFLEAPNLKDGERYLFINELLVNVSDNLREEIVNVNGHFYTTEKYLKYPLVSPMYQNSFDGFPPIMVIVGDEERFEDECMIFAYKLKSNNKGTSNSQQVILHVYDEMIHLFQTFDSHPSCQKSFELGSKFIADCLSDNINNNNDDQFWACRIDTKLNLTPLDYDITEYQISQTFSLKEEEA
ncbi:hypothetical protein K502DRAFT_359983 [Neoconidiobolus thromboides FSU 785]|nr:hypothetical protein K502DRAFT_359983 [Neoconidiobolus thromboides FSU 785]